jgi:hypothetical protein
MAILQYNPRWRVQVEGDQKDIDDLEVVLDPTVSGPRDRYLLARLEGVPTLMTTQWEAIDDPKVIKELANQVLRLFVGVLNVYSICRPLVAGTIYERAASGGYNMHRYTTIPIVVKTPKAVDPGMFARSVTLSSKHEWLASAFIEMGGTVDWYAIFRIIEAIEVFCGGEHGLKKSTTVDGAHLKLVKRMANSHRHLPDGTHSPPDPAISIEDARKAVRVALQNLLEVI